MGKTKRLLLLPVTTIVAQYFGREYDIRMKKKT